MKTLARLLMTGWGVLAVSIVSLILGFVAAGDGKWNGLAFGVFVLWFVIWIFLKDKGYFNLK